MTLRNRLRLALILIGGVVFLGAAGFHFIEGWDWFDGLYMTLITLTTVGYGETHPLSEVGRVFNAFLIVTAVMVGGFLVATFTQVMLEFELRNFLGRRRMEREISKLKNHYIICGAGRVGRTVAREFHSRHIPCVIVEQEAPRASWALEEGIPVLVGSAHAEEVLGQARIEHAKGLIAAVTSDADNLYIVLTARGMNPEMKIIARASEEAATPKLLRAGATEVVSPYHFVGRRIAQLLLRPHVLDFIDTAFGDQRLDMQIEEVCVADRSRLVGQSLQRADIRQSTGGALILALRRRDGSMNFNPPSDVVIQSGDTLIAIGSNEHLQKLEALAGA